ELTWGESVAVVGLGLLGQLAARIARIAGARPIFAIDPLAARLAALPSGPPYVPLPGVDLAVEASGNPRALPSQARLLRPQGRLLVLSSPSGPSAFDFHDLCNR